MNSLLGSVEDLLFIVLLEEREVCAEVYSDPQTPTPCARVAAECCLGVEVQSDHRLKKLWCNYWERLFVTFNSLAS